MAVEASALELLTPQMKVYNLFHALYVPAFLTTCFLAVI